MSQTKNQTMRKTARNVNLQLNSEKTVFEREKLRSLLWLKYSQAFFDFGVEQIFFAMGIEIVFSSTFRFLTGCSIYHSIFCSGKSKRADFFSYVFVCVAVAAIIGSFSQLIFIEWMDVLPYFFFLSVSLTKLNAH